jgi:hypothetical protein
MPGFEGDDDWNNQGSGGDYTVPTNDNSSGSGSGSDGGSNSGGGVFSWIGSIGSTIGMLFGRNNTGSTQPKYDTSATDQTARLAKTMFIALLIIVVVALIIFLIKRNKK